VFDAGPRSTDPSSEGSVGVRRKVQLRRGCDVISDLGDGAVVGPDVFGESEPKYGSTPRILLYQALAAARSGAG
jgi:hypothetical protein